MRRNDIGGLSPGEAIDGSGGPPIAPCTGSLPTVLTRGPAVPAELRNVHASAQLKPYLTEMVERRAYVWYVAKQELQHRQITSVLGNLWHLLNPALLIAVYFLVFGVVLDVAGRGDNFLLFLSVGLFIFQFGQKAITTGATSVTSNKGVVRAIRFPRAILPLSSTLTELLASVPTFVVMYGLALATGADPNVRWVAFPVVIAVQFLFLVGAAMATARLTTHFADTVQILPFVFRLLLYGSGVMFDVGTYFPDNGAARLLFTVNPFYCFVELGRWCVLGGAFQVDQAVSAAIWTIGALLLGFTWFRAGEEGFARD